MDMLLELVLGNAGAGMAVAVIMGGIKSAWKLEKPDKWKYWIPAIILSVCAVLGIMWYIAFFNIWAFILLTGTVAGFELLTQNEAWPMIKKIIVAVLTKLMKR
jgi:hypothetical protein